mgnify:CR=1 FL=1
MPYLRRIVDDELDELLPALPALSLEGAKGVEKPETALQRARTVHRLDDPAQQAITEANPSRLLKGEPRSSSTNGNRYRRSGTAYGEP